MRISDWSSDVCSSDLFSSITPTRNGGSMQIDLGNLSQNELEALIANAQRQKKKIHRQKISDVRRKVAALAKENGYTINELFGGVKATGKATAKVAPK